MKLVLTIFVIFVAYSCNLFQLVGANNEIDDRFFQTHKSSGSTLPTLVKYPNFYIASGGCSSQTVNIIISGANLDTISKIEFIHTSNSQDLGFEIQANSFNAYNGYPLDQALTFSVGPIAGASPTEDFDAYIHTNSGETILVIGAGTCTSA